MSVNISLSDLLPSAHHLISMLSLVCCKDLLVEPAVSLTACVARSDTSNSIPEGILPGCSVLWGGHKPTFAVVISSNKSRDGRMGGGPSSGTGAAMSMCLRLTYCRCPQMSVWDSTGDEHSISVVIVNVASKEWFSCPKLVAPHSTTHMCVASSSRKLNR